MRERKFDADMLEDLVDHRSGLAGVSGIGSDMRLLHDATSSKPAARLAIESFCFPGRKQIATMMAVLGGADLVVFTGGIGENDGEVRASICAGLSWAGVSLDNAADKSNPNPVSKAKGPRATVLPSQEDEQIARHTGAI